MEIHSTSSSIQHPRTKWPGKGAVIAGILPVMCILTGIILWQFTLQRYVVATWLTVAALILFSLLIYLGYTSGRFEWMGLSEDNDSSPKQVEDSLPGTSQVSEPATNHKKLKTFWDWLQLLIIPLVLSAAAIGFSIQQNQANQLFSQSQSNIANTQVSNALLIADQQRQQDMLQSYLDRMSELLLNSNIHIKGQQGDDVRILARARTLTVLQDLHKDGKITILNFLIYGGLIKRQNPQTPAIIDPIVNLKGADFSQISGTSLNPLELSGADLAYVNFRGATITKVHLSGAYLAAADFSKAHLQQAQLCGAQFIGALGETAILSSADLSEAHLEAANLQGVDLRGAILKGAILGSDDTTCQNQAQLEGIQLNGAADLSGANLTGADLSNADLKDTKLANAILTRVTWKDTICPDGTNSDKNTSHSCADHLI